MTRPMIRVLTLLAASALTAPAWGQQVRVITVLPNGGLIEAPGSLSGMKASGRTVAPTGGSKTALGKIIAQATSCSGVTPYAGAIVTGCPNDFAALPFNDTNDVAIAVP